MPAAHAAASSTGSFAFLIVASCCFTGCSGVSGDMNRMAEKLRADVKRSLDASELGKAHTVALASCLFAREMEAVNVKPRTEGGTSDALDGTQTPHEAGSFVYLGG